uniref:Uncharacterized protein n=1 Tax=Podarcis muralis TaxID=64176 RepID=A0A670K5D9_PODMU
MKVLILSILSLLAVANEARLFERCELAGVLRRYGLDGFGGYTLNDYLCAADQSSKLDTFYYENIDGVPRYGIFQLSGLEWCDNGRHSSQNKCHTLCDSEQTHRKGDNSSKMHNSGTRVALWVKPQSLGLADQKVGGWNPRDRVSSCCLVPAPANLAVRKHIKSASR